MSSITKICSLLGKWKCSNKYLYICIGPFLQSNLGDLFCTYQGRMAPKTNCDLFVFCPHFSPFFFLFSEAERSICLSKADRKSVIHPGMAALIAVSEHENWIQVDKSICGSEAVYCWPESRGAEEGRGGGLPIGFNTVFMQTCSFFRGFVNTVRHAISKQTIIKIKQIWNKLYILNKCIQ